MSQYPTHQQQKDTSFLNALMIPGNDSIFLGKKKLNSNPFIDEGSSSSTPPTATAIKRADWENNNNNNTNTNRKRSYGQESLEEEEEEEEDKKERKGRKAPHELLTDAEKKANHIASEKKRRQNIRLGFDQLIEIVPSLTQGNRSEAFILQKCKFHI
jgi:hypothetical protein